MAAPDYTAIQGPPATQDNFGGTSERWFFAPKRWITTIQTVLEMNDPAFTTWDQLVVIDTDHVFALGKGVVEMYATADTGMAKLSEQGELDGKSLKGEAEFFIPGLDPILLGQLRMLKNERALAWVECADGQLIQCGSKRFSCYISIKEIGTAKNSSGVRGSTVSLKWFESGITLYAGALPLI